MSRRETQAPIAPDAFYAPLTALMAGVYPQGDTA